MLEKPNTDGQICLKASNLEINYGKNLALDIEQLNISGRIIAVIGHNGSGKSTLIKSILQLLSPRKGKLITAWITEQQSMQLVPEQHMAFAQENGGIFADIRVESYLKLWCRIKHGRSDYYRREGQRFVEMLDISPLLGKLGRELSKGQKRRVQAAVGFLTNPRLFLFDEPFDGLDIAQSTQLANLMQEQSKDMGLILSSHRMDVVERLADLVVVLHCGKIFAVGTVEEVCRILCGKSIAISNTAEQRLALVSLLPALKREFYSCLINQIGDQLLITGSDATLESVESFFIRQNLFGVRLNPITPSLVDAMHYHLNRSLAQADFIERIDGSHLVQ